MAIGINTVKRLIAPIAQRMRLMVTRGVIERVNDSLKCQGLQISLLSDELRDDVEHFQEYGFTSHPFPGAEGLFLAVGSNRANGVVAIVTDRRYRPKNMTEGDVCLYTDNGERIYLERAGDIVNLGAKSAADFVALAADVKSELDSIKTDLDGIKSTFDSHVHITTATISAGPPGVLAAPASTAPVPHTPGTVAATKVKAT